MNFPGDAIGIDITRFHREREHRHQAACQPAFCQMQILHVHGTGRWIRFKRLNDDDIGGKQFVNGILNGPLTDLKPIFTTRKKVFLFSESMPVIGILPDKVQDTGAHALRVFVFHTLLAGDGIGDQKSGTRYILCQHVRILLDKGHRIRTVCFVYFCAIGSLNSHFLQKLHQTSKGVMLAPGTLYQGCFGFPDAVHFNEPFRVALDDLQGFGPECFHQSRGQRWTDAFNDTRSQVSTDAVYTGRQHHLK